MLKIDFLDTNNEKKARRSTILVALGFTLVVGALAAVGAGASYRAASHGTNVLSEVGNMLAFGDIRPFAWGTEGGTTTDALSTPDSKLNILLLGIGGEGHAGPQLTDTIIYASFDRSTNKLGLVSIPRDMAYPLGAGQFEKINAVNAYNEQTHPGQGADFTAQDFSKLFNVRIDRVVKIDFKGFAQLVDSLGGVDISVPTSFTDYTYPTDDDGPNPYKVQTISFTKGMQHMDGKRALEFVRSRHGTNGEGSDFARGRRQQLVIGAVRDKLLSLGTLSNPKTMSEIWTSLSSHIQTNLTAWDLIKLAPLAVHFSSENIISHVLTDDPKTGELVMGDTSNYMMFPRNSDWTQIRDIMADPFTSRQELAKLDHASSNVSVEIKNGTLRTGLAAQAAAKLQTDGYTVLSSSNAAHRGYEKTVIYDLTNGKLPEEVARLKRVLDANVASVSPSNGSVRADGGAEKITSSSTQFLIILGESSLGLLNTSTTP